MADIQVNLWECITPPFVSPTPSTGAQLKPRVSSQSGSHRTYCGRKRYTGPPGHCHGGIIATILDEAMGKVNKLRHVVALTSQITVNYLKPVPLNKPLRVESREVRVRGRQHINMAEIFDQKGEVLARSRGTFIAVDAERMFAKYA